MTSIASKSALQLLNKSARAVSQSFQNAIQARARAVSTIPKLGVDDLSLELRALVDPNDLGAAAKSYNRHIDAANEARFYQGAVEAILNPYLGRPELINNARRDLPPARRNYVILGAGGMGEPTAKRLAADQARLTVVDRPGAPQLASLKQELQSLTDTVDPDRIRCIGADMLDEDAMADVAHIATQGYDRGQCDGVISTVGVFSNAPANQICVEHLRLLSDVNVHALLVALKSFIGPMLLSTNATIAAVTSIAGHPFKGSKEYEGELETRAQVKHNQAPYGWSKHLQVSVFDGMRVILPMLRIKPTELVCGPVATTMLEGRGLDLEGVPTGEDVANEISHILSCPPHVNLGAVHMQSAKVVVC